MANIAIYDPNSTPQKIIQYLESVNTPDYSNRSDVVINPDLSSLASVPIRYWKHVSGSILEMSQAEKDAIDAAAAADILNNRRQSGKSLLDSEEGQGIVLRALADIIKDEINILRGWLLNFKFEVNQSTSLADLKTRVNNLSDTPDRTLLQLRMAIQNRINTGSVDN